MSINVCSEYKQFSDKFTKNACEISHLSMCMSEQLVQQFV